MWFARIQCTALVLALTPLADPVRARVYVADPPSHNVVAIDTVTLKVVGALPAGTTRWCTRRSTVLYYYPDPNDAGHYNTDGVRYFHDFATGKIITK